MAILDHLGRVIPKSSWLVLISAVVAIGGGCKQRRSSAKLENATAVGTERSGVTFAGCPNKSGIQKDMAKLLSDNSLTAKVKINQTGSAINYVLDREETNTLDLSDDSEWDLSPDRVYYKYSNGREVTRSIPSQKEILIALLSPGRGLVLDKEHCHVFALLEHIMVRQRISLVGDLAVWQFPQGTGSGWNPNYWNHADKSVHAGVKPSDALEDMINRRNNDGSYTYRLGCTTACKSMMVIGTYSYFKNGSSIADERKGEGELIKKARLSTLSKLEADMDPLEDVDPESRKFGGRPTKILMQVTGVPWDNWIPGDWGYILNTDPFTRSPEDNDYSNREVNPNGRVKRQKAIDEFQGLEGTNIVYIGQGMFSAYYEGRPNRGFRESVLRDYGWRYEYGNLVGRGMGNGTQSLMQETTRAERDEIYEIAKHSPNQPGFECPRASSLSEKQRWFDPPKCGSIEDQRKAPRVLGDYSEAIQAQMAEEGGSVPVTNPASGEPNSVAARQIPDSPTREQVVIHVVDVPANGPITQSSIVREKKDLASPIPGVQSQGMVPDIVTGLRNVDVKPPKPGHVMFYNFTLTVENGKNWDLLNPDTVQFPALKACAKQLEDTSFLSDCKGQTLLSDLTSYQRNIICRGQADSKGMMPAALSEKIKAIGCVVGLQQLMGPMGSNSPTGNLYKDALPLQ